MARVLLFLGILFFAGQPPERAWLRRGVAQYHNGAYGDAEVSFRRALAARPGFAQARYNLGHALYRQQRYAEALECYRQARTGLPRHALAQWHRSRANTLLQLNRLPEAASAYRQALRLQPGFESAQKNLSYILLKTTEKDRKNVVRNMKPAPRQPNPDKNEKPGEEEAGEKPGGNNASGSESQSKSRIQSPQAQLSQPDMESLLRQLDQAEKQVRGRKTKAKTEKTTGTEQKDW